MSALQVSMKKGRRSSDAWLKKSPVGCSTAQRRKENGQRTLGLRCQRSAPGSQCILSLYRSSGLVPRIAQMEGIGPPPIADFPALGQRRRGPLLLVERRQPLEEFSSDGKRRRVVDQGWIERLGILRLDQLQVGGGACRSPGWPWRRAGRTRNTRG